MALRAKRTGTKRAGSTRARTTTARNTGGGQQQTFPLNKQEIRSLTSTYNKWMDLGQKLQPHMRKLEQYHGGTVGRSTTAKRRTTARTGRRSSQSTTQQAPTA